MLSSIWRVHGRLGGRRPSGDQGVTNGVGVREVGARSVRWGRGLVFHVRQGQRAKKALRPIPCGVYEVCRVCPAPARTPRSRWGGDPWGVAIFDLQTSECSHQTLFLSLHP